jgi:hypothetical protein
MWLQFFWDVVQNGDFIIIIIIIIIIIGVNDLTTMLFN